MVLRTRLAKSVFGVGAAALAMVGLTSCPGPATLTVTNVVTGLDHPWDLSFRPDGTLFFTERAGRINVRTSAGVVRTLASPSDVVAVGEGGMLGIATDPAFESNRRLYTCMLSNVSGSLDVRLVRWVVDAGLTTLSARADIVTGLPANPTGRHSGCRPRFGPDGYLWLGTGDSASPTVPQSPTSLGGKVLRVDTNGVGAAGNPGGGLDARIYSLGHRNVQGVSFDAQGVAWSVEHGTNRDDEVNKLVAGGNYGWDPRPLSGPLFYDESRPMTDLTRYPSAMVAFWSSGTPTIAPSGGTFITGSGWKGWQNDLAMAVLKGQQLRVLEINTDRATLDGQQVRISDQGRLRVAVMGPDGNLYLATDATAGKILKVVPSG